MNNNELIDQAINNCPYLLRILIERNEILKEDTGKWLEKIIEAAREDWFDSRFVARNYSVK